MEGTGALFGLDAAASLPSPPSVFPSELSWSERALFLHNGEEGEEEGGKRRKSQKTAKSGWLG